MSIFWKVFSEVTISTVAHPENKVAQNSSGNLYIRRSTGSGSGTTGERIAFRTSSSPSSAVDISGFENGGSSSGNGILRLYKGTSTSTPLVMGNNEIDSYAGSGLHLNYNSSKAVYLAANTGRSSYVYMVRGSGRVGIGNLSESQITHKLTVDGGIKAEEIVVDTVGADFVFEDDYCLVKPPTPGHQRNSPLKRGSGGFCP